MQNLRPESETGPAYPIASVNNALLLLLLFREHVASLNERVGADPYLERSRRTCARSELCLSSKIAHGYEVIMSFEPEYSSRKSSHHKPTLAGVESVAGDDDMARLSSGHIRRASRRNQIISQLN